MDSLNVEVLYCCFSLVNYIATNKYLGSLTTKAVCYIIRKAKMCVDKATHPEAWRTEPGVHHARCTASKNSRVQLSKATV